MAFDWNEYSGDNSVPLLSLLISERSQSLILAAMRVLDSRSSWTDDIDTEDISDSDWNDIEKSVANAYTEIMEIVAMSGTLTGAMMHNTSDQNVGLPSATWNNINFQTADYDTEDYIQSPDIQCFYIPSNGVYLIGFSGVWQANSSGDSFLRSARFERDDGITVKPISLSNQNVVTEQVTHNMVITRVLDAGDKINVAGFTDVPNLNMLYLAGQSAYFWIEKLRELP